MDVICRNNSQISLRFKQKSLHIISIICVNIIELKKIIKRSLKKYINNNCYVRQIRVYFIQNFRLINLLEKGLKNYYFEPEVLYLLTQINKLNSEYFIFVLLRQVCDLFEQV